MYRFQCDYTEGAHPAIMQRMVETNMEQTDGYGLDPYCDSARQKIKDLCECQDADVHFLVGGTQTNTTVISAALRPYQGAVAAVSGHINVHETGAIEATGHKVLPLPSGDGKISAVQVDEMCHAHFTDGTQEHMVQPGCSGQVVRPAFPIPGQAVGRALGKGEIFFGFAWHFGLLFQILGYKNSEQPF